MRFAYCALRSWLGMPAFHLIGPKRYDPAPQKRTRARITCHLTKHREST